MIDAVAVPLLLKAVDFLFGQGSKILEERRERRRAQQDTGIGESEGQVSKSGGPVIPSEVIASKEIALGQSIPEAAWSGSEAKIKHLMALLEIHTKNYYLAKEQYAKWGTALVPPIIVHNLTEAENNVAATTKELQLAISVVYGKSVTAPEVDQA